MKTKINRFESAHRKFIIVTNTFGIKKLCLVVFNIRCKMVESVSHHEILYVIYTSGTYPWSINQENGLLKKKSLVDEIKRLLYISVSRM